MVFYGPKTMGTTKPSTFRGRQESNELRRSLSYKGKNQPFSHSSVVSTLQPT